ncbi:hypothetical protein C8263_07845 [Deinococcus arcticus]|uniref:Uncharacterized protein n=1 Tax=Deinococcus arcticus TaxID=2136176 RepID=A0A2T3W9H5_9DEIO|nr:hypothetical protein C8263_07845 [Deinococcus arcticus]
MQADVPDEILSDALLDVTPEELRRLMAAVPEDVMARAIGQVDDVRTQPVKAEDLQQLQGLGSALDELDIWSFGDDSAAPGDHKA